MQDYKKLQYEYLAEAEKMFGPKTDYVYLGLYYHNYRPRTVLHDKDFFTGESFYKIELQGIVIDDRKEGIFQLSHEVVHLLSPVEQDEGNEVNYLEEGMATYFSKIITERDTGDYDYCNSAFLNYPKYQEAYNLYNSLIEIDPNAVKKLRAINPVIGSIKPNDFVNAGLNVKEELINALLNKF